MGGSTGLIARTRPRRVGVLACLMATIVAMTLGVAPVAATTIDHFRSTQSYDDVRWDCGYPMRVVGSVTDAVVVRADKRLDGNVFVSDNYAFDETWTAGDGRWFRVTGDALAKDVKAKPLGGTLYEFTFKNPGQPQTVFDSTGNVVARDRGNVTVTYTIDIADGTFTFVGASAAGPHPGFDNELCKLVAPLTGSGSERYLAPRPIGSTDFSMGYYEYLPPSYSASGTQSPLLIALNGYGETGDGTPGALSRLLAAGIPRFIDIGGWPTARRLVVLALQHVEDPPGFDFSSCDGVYPGGGSCNMFRQDALNNVQPAFCTTPDEVHDFIAYAVARYNVDPKRVYLTGLSCGGFGTWEYLAKYGDQVAAAIPIAGEGRPAWAKAGCGLGSVAIWAFHGELDDVVDPAGSIEPVTKLQACPGVTADRAKLTIYPGLFHDGWDQAYSGSLGDDIYAWMLGFAKP